MGLDNVNKKLTVNNRDRLVWLKSGVVGTPLLIYQNSERESNNNWANFNNYWLNQKNTSVY